MDGEAFTPLRCSSLVVKVASRCNLNCSYCYMYNKGDSSYKLQPKFMTTAVLEAMLQRVRTHCLTHGMDGFTFVLHGGEPLLAGLDFIRNFVETTRQRLQPEIHPPLPYNQRSVAYTRMVRPVLMNWALLVGISLDGTREANDEYRVDHSGRGSYR